MRGCRFPYAVFMRRPPSPISISYAALSKYPLPANVGGSSVDRDQAQCAGQPTRGLNARTDKEQSMLDVILLVVGLGFFALSIAYAFACDWL